MNKERRDYLNDRINEIKYLHNRLLDEGIFIEEILHRILKSLQAIQSLIIKTEGNTCVTLPLIDTCLDTILLKDDGLSAIQRYDNLQIPLKTMFSSIYTDTYYNDTSYKYYEFISADNCENNIADKKYFINDNISVNVLKNMYIKAYNSFSYIFYKDKVLEESDGYKSEMDRFPPPKKMRSDSNRIIMLKKACNLASRYTNINYGHTIYESLSLFIMMENYGYDGNYMMFDSIDIKSILNILNFDMNRIIWLTQSGTTYHVEELHVTTPIATVGWEVTYDSVNDLANRILNNINTNDLQLYPKRIYVKRIGKRKIINEKELLSVLNEYNFHTIILEELSIEEEAKHFYAADIVITAHGSNSANNIYMRPSTHFMECFGRNYMRLCFAYILCTKKVNYYLLCTSGQIESQIGTCVDDFEVDINLLRTYLIDIMDNYEG